MKVRMPIATLPQRADARRCQAARRHVQLPVVAGADCFGGLAQRTHARPTAIRSSNGPPTSFEAPTRRAGAPTPGPGWPRQEALVLGVPFAAQGKRCMLGLLHEVGIEARTEEARAADPAFRDFGRRRLRRHMPELRPVMPCSRRSRV